MGSADADKNSFGCVANIIWLDNTFQNQNIFQVRNQGYLDNNINVYNLLQVNQYELQICDLCVVVKVYVILLVVSH